MDKRGGFDEFSNYKIDPNNSLTQAITNAKEACKADSKAWAEEDLSPQDHTLQGEIIDYGSQKPQFPIGWLLAVVVIILVYMFCIRDNNSIETTHTPTPERVQTQHAEYEKPLPVNVRGENHVLTEGELRWILRREMVLEAMRPYVESRRACNEFNAMVDDYNMCAKGKYYQSLYDRVKSEIEEQKDEIEEEALDLVKSWNGR